MRDLAAGNRFAAAMAAEQAGGITNLFVENGPRAVPKPTFESSATTKNQRVFLSFSINGEPGGRLVAA